MFAWDEGLDDAQLTAVTHGESPLAVLAGAGTGKTRTLTARVAFLLERGVPPERILLLTFTRRAADDMLARAAAITRGPEHARRLRGGTFHAIVHQVVSAWGEALGIPPEFSVIDPSDAADLFDLLRDEHGLCGTETRMPRGSTLCDLYSRCVNTRHTLSEMIAADFPWCEPHLESIVSSFKAYVERKRERAQLDFDDLLLYWGAALVQEHTADLLRGSFDYVLVDEFQDVNSLQVDIVRRLCPQGRGLTFVGDDAQAIYGFRGARAGHMHDLAEELSATVIRLERNFRSLQPILDAANVVRATGGCIAGPDLELRATRNGGRRPSLVHCHDAGTEARAVVDRILDRNDQGLGLKEQAVLVRAAHHSDLIELELTARRVPYRKYGGLRFVEAAHVKDFVAAARIVENPADDLAWFRLLRLHHGVGPARARCLLEVLAPRSCEDEVESSQAVAAAPPTARVQLASTLRALADARRSPTATTTAAELVQLLRPLLEARYDDWALRLGDLERLASAAASAEDLRSWIAEITLDPPASCGDLARPPHVDEDFVVISTVHSAKGLEWKVVHLPHLVDGAFPSDMALRYEDGLAEERRLFYVATTRARDELILYAPLRMPHHRRAKDDRHTFAPRSRFLDSRLLELLSCEEVSPPRPRVGRQSPERLRVPAKVQELVGLDPLWR